VRSAKKKIEFRTGGPGKKITPASDPNGRFGANLPRTVWSKSAKDCLEQICQGSFGAN